MSTKIAVALSDPNYTASSQIGTSEYNGTTFSNLANVLSGTTLSNDVKVFWFKNVAGAERILVAETQYDPITYAPNPSQLSVYAGTGSSWGSPPLFGPVAFSFDGTTPTAANSIINLYGIIEKTVGGVHYLYGIDYDQKTVFRLINSSGDSYAMDTTVKFVPDVNDRGVQTFGQDIVIVEETNSSVTETFVCALFLDGTNVYGGNYNPSLLYKLDTNLSQVGAVGHVGKNATGIKFRTVTTGTDKHTTLYIPSIGGGQKFGTSATTLLWNPDSKLQTVPVANITSVTNRLAVAAGGGPGNNDDGMDIRDIAIDNSGNALVFAGCYYNDVSSPLFSYMKGRLYSLPVSDIDSASDSLLTNDLAAPRTPFQGLDGWVWSLAYDRIDNRTWFGRGNQFDLWNNPGSTAPTVTAGPVSSASLGSFSPQRGNVNSFTVYGHVRLRSAHPSPAFHSNSSMALKARPEFIEQLKQTAATK